MYFGFETNFHMSYDPSNALGSVELIQKKDKNLDQSNTNENPS